VYDFNIYSTWVLQELALKYIHNCPAMASDNDSAIVKNAQKATGTEDDITNPSVRQRPFLGVLPFMKDKTQSSKEQGCTEP
jgi:hypothetical protein